MPPMRILRHLTLLLVLGVCLRAGETYVPFRADLAAGTAYALDARQIHPTQFYLGWREVAAKRDLLNRMSPAEVTNYLKKKDVPIVIGPQGVPYLTDGHHTLRALIESTTADKTAYGHILANWSDLGPAEFWRRMQERKYAFLLAPGGEARDAETLPASLLHMELDPYRGLAWAVMAAGGFNERKDVFFQEFYWADYFRERVEWDDRDDTAFAAAVDRAIVLARQPAAWNLPGYHGPSVIQPRVVTESVRHDTDDPAIWIDPVDPARSLVIGTDKDTDGALYAFDLAGRVVRTVRDLRRPNNVDIATGFRLGGREVALAVTTEREARRLRVFTVPDLEAVDRGNLVVFNGDPHRAPMGVALYRRPRDGALFAIVGGKSGPTEGYLAQYRLEDDGTGKVAMSLVRHFGAYSGRKEVEAIAVDAELGYVYYSDEQVGVRKYAADPEAAEANRELALFATAGFAADHEGIAIYRTGPGTGYLVISDQQANALQFFPREGTAGRPHDHPALAKVPVAALECDGCEVTTAALPGFPGGLFVAMSTDRTFHFYAWNDLAAAAGLGPN